MAVKNSNRTDPVKNVLRNKHKVLNWIFRHSEGGSKESQVLCAEDSMPDFERSQYKAFEGNVSHEVTVESGDSFEI